MRAPRFVLLILPVVAWTAVPVQAQWVVTPHLGLNIAGDVEEGKGGFGGSVGYLGGRLGFELDFGRHHHFFKDEDVVDLVPDSCVSCAGPRTDFDTDAVSFMGNLVVPFHTPGAPKWRPYGTAGLGVIRAWLDSSEDQFDRHQNNLGFNVGGGLMYSLNDRVRLRGDLRYFRALVDEDKREGVSFKDYGFWRVAVGVTFVLAR